MSLPLTTSALSAVQGRVTAANITDATQGGRALVTLILPSTNSFILIDDIATVGFADEGLTQSGLVTVDVAKGLVTAGS